MGYCTVHQNIAELLKCVCIVARVCIRSRCDVRQYLQAAEDALLGEMAAVKAGMERRQKREKRRKLEQKKKSRVRAAQAAAGMHTLLALCQLVYPCKARHTSMCS